MIVGVLVRSRCWKQEEVPANRLKRRSDGTEIDLKYVYTRMSPAFYPDNSVNHSNCPK